MLLAEAVSPPLIFMINPKDFGKGYKKEKFKLKHLLRRRLNIHKKYLSASPIDVLAISKLFPVKNQGTSGSCGGQAWAYYLQVLKYLRDNTITELSAHDIYSHCWTPPEGSDEGHLINFVENSGADSEADVTSYMSGQPPTEQFMEQVLQRNEDVAFDNIVFQPITFGGDINSIKTAINVGNGCVIAVYGDNQGWQTQNGVVEAPQSKDWGHWLFAVKADDSTRLVTVKNSWGQEAGDNGYYYLPYSYFENGNVMGGWIFQLRPADYTVSLLEKIVQLYQNIISEIK